MFLDTRLGNTRRLFLTRPRDWGMRVPDDICDCVVFVGRAVSKGSVEDRVPSGTALPPPVTSSESCPSGPASTAPPDAWRRATA